MGDSLGEEFLCLSSLVKFLNQPVIERIQEDQFTYVICIQKVSDVLS